MGFGQWISDTWHFGRSMTSQIFGDNSYTPPAYSEPVSADQEERKQQRDEANRYTKNAQVIAKNVETGLVAVPEAVETVTLIKLARAIKAGKASAKLSGKVGKAMSGGSLIRAATGSFTEDIMNEILEGRGEAPVQSLRARIMPPILGGDEHYQNQGSPNDHPERPKAPAQANTGIVTPLEMLQGAGGVVKDVVELPFKIANTVKNAGQALLNGETASAPPPADDITKPAAKNTGSGFFGIGSVIAIILGLLAAIVNPIAGMAIAAIGIVGPALLKGTSNSKDVQSTPPAPTPNSAQQIVNTTTPPQPLAPQTPTVKGANALVQGR